MSQKDRQIWAEVQETPLAELRFRVHGDVLVIDTNTVDELADNLADVIIANFAVTRRRRGLFR
jgi:hypothetical protein